MEGCRRPTAAPWDMTGFLQPQGHWGSGPGPGVWIQHMEGQASTRHLCAWLHVLGPSHSSVFTPAPQCPFPARLHALESALPTWCTLSRSPWSGLWDQHVFLARSLSPLPLTTHSVPEMFTPQQHRDPFNNLQGGQGKTNPNQISLVN